MATRTVRIRGYDKLQRSIVEADKATKKEARASLREAAEVVRKPWAAEDLDRFGAKTAKGMRTVVRKRGVAVEQSLRKSTVESRRRPKFGKKQQEIGDRITAEHAAELQREFDAAGQRIADRFDWHI